MSAHIILVSPIAASYAEWQDENRRLLERAQPEDAAAQQEIMASQAFQRGEPEAYEALYRHTFSLQFHDRAKAEALPFSDSP